MVNFNKRPVGASLRAAVGLRHDGLYGCLVFGNLSSFAVVLLVALYHDLLSLPGVFVVTVVSFLLAPIFAYPAYRLVFWLDANA